MFMSEEGFSEHGVKATRSIGNSPARDMAYLDPLPPLVLPTFPTKPEPKFEQPELDDVWSQVRAHPPPPKVCLLGSISCHSLNAL